MYLTLDDWDEMGGDPKIDELVYNRHEFKARKLIDRMTRGRIINDSPVRDTVKYCMYDLVNAMIADETLSGASGQQVSSMSNDGVSITYATGESARASIRYAAIVRGWLSGETTDCGTPLMYAGVDA